MSEWRGESNIPTLISLKLPGHMKEIAVLLAAICWFFRGRLTKSTSYVTDPAVFLCGLRVTCDHFVPPEPVLYLSSTSPFYCIAAPSNVDDAARCCTASAVSRCVAAAISSCCFSTASIAERAVVAASIASSARFIASAAVLARVAASDLFLTASSVEFSGGWDKYLSSTCNSCPPLILIFLKRPCTLALCVNANDIP